MNFYYQCIECDRKYKSEKKILYVCPVCSLNQKPDDVVRGILRIILPYEKLLEKLDRYSFHPHELLPIESDFLPDYSVGNTPLVAADRIRAEQHFPKLFFKNDSLNPTGSLKDRASFLVAAVAKKYGIRRIVTASTGNAASAMAGVAASCGLECIVLIPYDAPRAKLVQSFIYGAKVIPIKGTYDKAFDLAIQFTEKYGGINRNTAYNPFTIEGKKTVALEIYKQLGYCAPDVIFIPTGDGVILSGVYKGFYDLLQFNWIEKMPQLVAVQAEGSDAIVRGISTGKIEPLTDAQTIADSICVAAPRNGILALKDINNSGGFGVTVSDQQILDVQQYLGNKTGIFVEPAAAAAFAGFVKSKDRLDKNAKVVILLTGNGLKDISGVLDYLKLPQPVEPKVENIDGW